MQGIHAEENDVASIEIRGCPWFAVACREGRRIAGHDGRARFGMGVDRAIGVDDFPQLVGTWADDQGPMSREISVSGIQVKRFSVPPHM